MKKIYVLGTGMLFTILLSHVTISQKVNSKISGTSIGKCENLLSSINNELTSSALKRTKLSLHLKITNEKSLNANINFKQSIDLDGKYLVGVIEDIPGSSFFLRTTSTSLQGNILLQNTKQAFRYYSDEKGNAYVTEADINTIICINYGKTEDHPNSKRIEAVTATAALDLQSFPGATGCILLDFDGQYVSGSYWNGGNPINAAPSGMSDAAIQDTWELVSEDFRSFNMNITTSEAVFNTYPKSKRMRCIITPTDTAAPGSGGVAYIGSFSWNDDNPCWVFITSIKSAGEAASHEIGHTLGLNHDGRSNPAQAYYSGQGNWAPIMGVGYYKSVTQWSNGEYTSSNNKEDDMTIISNVYNSVGYRVDDHGNTASSATPLISGTSGIVSPADNKGIIERATDVDFFSFNTGGGNVVLNFNGAAKYSNLDILINLYNSAGQLIGTYNPTGLNAALNVNLAKGKYCVSVDGTGADNPSTDGYSDYASLGNFSISGTIPVLANQPPSVTLSAPINGTIFIAPASFTINASASDADGSIAKVGFYSGNTLLIEDASFPYSATLNNVSVGSYIITAKAIDNSGLSATSAPIEIKVNSSNVPPTVSFISPANGTVYASPPSITIHASALDIDGSITKVILYNGLTKMMEDVKEPYSFTWSNPGNGSYSFTLTAIDNLGASTTSSPINIQVNNTVDNKPPLVSINSPLNGSTVQAQIYNLSINISASDPDGSIAAVELYDGTLKLIQDNTYPYSFTWSNIPSGTYSFMARAIDNLGASTNSATVTVTINAPASNSASVLVADNINSEALSAIIVPNPFTDEFSLRLEGAESADVQIFELCNKEISSRFKIKSEERINMSEFGSGIYIVKINTADKVLIKRVLKK